MQNKRAADVIATAPLVDCLGYLPLFLVIGVAIQCNLVGAYNLVGVFKVIAYRVFSATILGISTHYVARRLHIEEIASLDATDGFGSSAIKLDFYFFENANTWNLLRRTPRRERDGGRAIFALPSAR